ncbi:MAG TPA: V-type ATP synthase subunit I [Clostridia bacterium]|nr:V-type ATP synthase subunit I [Clostridia bacterium]HQM96698.1 V-type ATP synthase subunit I [Clostridia bacterium]
MAIVEMQKICITGLVKEKKPMLSFLMKRGVIDIQDILIDSEYKDVFSKGYDRNFEAGIDSDMSLLSKAISILEEYDISKKPLFKVRKDIDRKHYEAIAKNDNKIIRFAEDIIKTDNSIKDYKSEINERENNIHSLMPWTELYMPINMLKTDKVNIILGTIPEFIKPQAYIQSIDERGFLCQVQEISKDKNNAYVAVYLHESDMEKPLQYLKSIGFTVLEYNFEGIPHFIIEDNKRDIAKLRTKIDKAKESLKEHASKISEIQAVYDHFSISKGLLVVDDKILSGKYSYIIDGWIPKEKAEKIANELEKNYICDVILRDPYDDEQFPVLLKNGFMGEAVSGVTEMFSLPNCREADPNPVTAIFFALFFGMMLSDAGYGLIMVIACALVLIKFKLEFSTSRFIKLMLISGIATILVGALYGSWFGNFIPTILSDTSLDIALWFDPIKDPNRLLMWSLILGIIHIYVGYGIKGYNRIKKKKYLDAVLDVLPWYFFFTTACFMVSSYIPSVPEGIYNALTPIGTKLFPYAAAAILLTQGRHKKGILGKLFGGIASFYDLISFMGDVLSYSRLLAMGLATGVIGTIINQMGSSGGFTIVGVISFTLIFVVGHGFNFAINALGAYVHSSRLQYIEFFNKFFEGGGIAYSPLFEDTKYIKIKE